MKSHITKVLALILTVACLAAVVLSGCTGKDTGNNVTQMYIDKNKEFGIDWDTIISNLKEIDPEASGLYVDKENLEEEVNEYFTVSFTNYDPTVNKSFKKVDNQILITYGVCTKNEFAYETPEFYDEPVFEIDIHSNSSDKYYTAVYNANKELLSEDGSWLLSTDKSETISEYIDVCSAAMGL